MAGVALGDVWPHGALPENAPGANLVRFHKLTQWWSTACWSRSPRRACTLPARND
ncbi:MAG: DUF1688 family protein [SAR324 cluster bacterium]|nr:DUF1688 family protein [SAR324 cluster bacterium]